MQISIKRVYEQPTKNDGTRVLVDRLWPRGLKREDAALHVWAKELSPSTELRRWFDHAADKFDAFAEKYRRELKRKHAQIAELMNCIDRRRRLTLLYAAKDPLINHAVVLRDYLRSHW